MGHMTQIPPARTRGKGPIREHKQCAIWVEMSRSEHEKWNHTTVFTFFFSILTEILQDHRALGTSGKKKKKKKKKKTHLPIQET